MQIQLYSELSNQLNAIEKLGDWYTKSGIFRCTRVEQGRTIVVMCMTMNITPIEFLATYDLIDGVPRKKALACYADFRKRGGRCKWMTESDDLEKAIGQFSFEGEVLTVRFTIKDAARQGLVKPNSNWAKTPSNMLRARVITTAIGMLAPEVVAGVDDVPPEWTAGETLDIAGAAKQERSVNATTPVTPAPLPEKPAPEALPAPAAPPVEIKTEAEAESEMGLAPAVVKSEPAKPQMELRTLEPEIAAPGPIPPPQAIEPEATQAAPKPTPEPPPPAPNRVPTTAPGGVEQLDEQTIDNIGNIIKDHFLEAALWMIKQGWIPPSPMELNNEFMAMHHIRAHLPNLPKAYAKRILTKKGAFMRAVQEINPQ